MAAEAIPERLPHLDLAQVFDALSYYSSHQQKIDAYIERPPSDKLNIPAEES